MIAGPIACDGVAKSKLPVIVLGIVCDGVAKSKLGGIT